MKRKICFIVMAAFLFSSCVVSYRGTLYGRVSRQCPTLNPTAFFYEKGTGKPFLPRNVFRKRRTW
jgi:hypothetical protein